MTGGSKAVVVALVATLGLWGCARGPASSAGAERLKALEQKVAKLEDDFRAASAARDSFRQKLDAQSAQLQLVAKERDELRRVSSTRTAERDALQVQYDQFRKGIRDLLGQAEAAVAPAASQPVTAVTSTTAPGKS